MGKTTQVNATPNTGWDFVNWTDNNVVVSTNENFTFEVTKDTHLIANFKKKTFTIQIGLSGSGNASGAGSYLYGDEATLLATPDKDSKFIGWFMNDELLSSETQFIFNVDKNYEIVAKFEEIFYTVTLEAKPEEGGTVSGGGTI